ncbi:MAG: hypothetical protein R3265_10240 [Hyphomonas sp.]|nr:hypothetical protein [Hyphomonas sp.]
MNMLEFSFGNAMGHFQKTGGPKGFLWKFALAYALFGIIVQALSLFLMMPIYSAAFDPVAMQDPDVMDQVMLENIGRVLLGYLVSFVFGILMWLLFEAASQRRYMRGDGFSLKLGADEGRLFVVGLFWFGLMIALYIGMVICMIVPMSIGAAMGRDGALIAGLLMFVLMIGFMVLAIWIMARFSPAAAMTIRDRKIRFGSAWRATKGKVWTLIGSWLVLGLIMMVIVLVLYFVLAITAVVSLMPVLQSGSDDPAAVMGALASPGFIVSAIIFGLVYMGLAGAMMHVFGGPAALAAKTDPEWADTHAINETFV